MDETNRLLKLMLRVQINLAGNVIAERMITKTLLDSQGRQMLDDLADIAKQAKDLGEGEIEYDLAREREAEIRG